MPIVVLLAEFIITSLYIIIYRCDLLLSLWITLMAWCPFLNCHLICITSLSYDYILDLSCRCFILLLRVCGEVFVVLLEIMDLSRIT